MRMAANTPRRRAPRRAPVVPLFMRRQSAGAGDRLIARRTGHLLDDAAE
jgi:hypothetical protein